LGIEGTLGKVTGAAGVVSETVPISLASSSSSRRRAFLQENSLLTQFPVPPAGSFQQPLQVPVEQIVFHQPSIGLRRGALEPDVQVLLPLPG
jgi:hypothetical protein